MALGKHFSLKCSVSVCLEMGGKVGGQWPSLLKPNQIKKQSPYPPNSPPNSTQSNKIPKNWHFLVSNVEHFSWRRKVDIFTLYQRISSFLTYRITDLGPWSNYWTFTHIYHYMWLYVILFFYSRSLFPLFPGTSYLGYPISISNSVW